MSSLRPCQQKIQRQTLICFQCSIILTWNPEKRDWPPDNPGMHGNMEQLPISCMHARVLQMWTAKGTCVIALCCPSPYKCTSHRGQNLSSTSPPRQTLAPPLALDDAGDEALSCRDLTDAVLTPAADIVFSAIAVGVLRRQVRAWKIELLGLLSHSV